MRSSIIFAATAAAFVVPDAAVFNQLPLRENTPDQNAVSELLHSLSETPWTYPQSVADEETAAPTFRGAGEKVAQVVKDAVDKAESMMDSVPHGLMELQQEFSHQLSSSISRTKETIGSIGKPHEYPDKTVYELIKLSSYTTRFAAIVDKHPSVVKILNSTDPSDKITLFAPIDDAFNRIPPEDEDGLSDEFVEAALLYHVGLGEWPSVDILKVRSVPTALKEDALGGESQRLRTQIKLTGLTLNFYAKVVAVDIAASNGYIHAIKSVLLPPKESGRELTLFPGIFSTLVLAMEKTNFVSFVNGLHFEGTTIFAPWNRAFARLGIRVNAFLFNTEEGLGYLKAILKYHVAPNATLYTDAFYDKTGADSTTTTTTGHQHFELKTLLKGASVGVDIGSWGIFSKIKVNGFAGVPVDDVPAKNAVIQVVDRVLIPPHRHGDAEEQADGEMTVDELKERLADYV